MGDLEPLRRRPAMWVGSADDTGILYLLLEVVTRAALPKFANRSRRVSVTCHRDHSFSVHDDGRGLPMSAVGRNGVSHPQQEMHFLSVYGGDGLPEEEQSYIEQGFLYDFASTLNAFTEWLEITTRSAGFEYTLAFARGGLTWPTTATADAQGSGTTLSFRPDFTIFSRPLTDFGLLQRRCLEIESSSGVCVAVVIEGA